MHGQMSASRSVSLLGITVPYRMYSHGSTTGRSKCYVAIRPIVRRFGLQWKPQFEKIKRAYRNETRMFKLEAEDGMFRDMIAIPGELACDWLSRVPVARIDCVFQEAIAEYQRMIDDPAMYKQDIVIAVSRRLFIDELRYPKSLTPTESDILPPSLGRIVDVDTARRDVLLMLVKYACRQEAISLELKRLKLAS